MMAIIKDKIWPFISQSMKAFIEHPRFARMLAAREPASTTSAGYAGYTGSAAYTAYAGYATYAESSESAAEAADDTKVFLNFLR